MKLLIILFVLIINSLSETIPNVEFGWDTTVGEETDRIEAANFFKVNISDDESLWTNNVMTPFIGKTMKMTDIVIEERNAFNSLIEYSVRNGEVLWKVEKGPLNGKVMGPWTEVIDGTYTGVANVAGFASKTSWIEHDHKSKFGFKLAYDWGFVDVLSATETTVVMHYWSYKKAKFIMTWSTNY